VQLIVDDGYRGRVMGVHTVLFAGVGAIRALILGAVARDVRPADGADALVRGGPSQAPCGSPRNCRRRSCKTGAGALPTSRRSWYPELTGQF
jgi:hypothetical protein